MPLEKVTLIVPYYRNCRMLERQLCEWEQYPDGVRIIVVDDGSPEPAKPIIERSPAVSRVDLYRITVDVPWNREEARNLGALQAGTDWLIQTDIDHLLPVAAAQALLAFTPDPRYWYRFTRWRKGRADETRLKDEIADNVEFGLIKPHIDSYLVRRSVYWRTGGYDLRFSGCLGGGTEFLRRLGTVAPVVVLPPEICLHVYTRTEIKDASDWSLSRDRTEGKRRMRLKASAPMRERNEPIKSPWERQL